MYKDLILNLLCLLLIGLVFLICSFVLYCFADKLYTFILLRRPMWLVSPKTPKEYLIKKYAKWRIIDDEDEPYIENLSGHIEIILAEVKKMTGGGEKIVHVKKAKSYDGSIKRLKLGDLDF